MPITGIEQPEVIQIDDSLRLRRFDDIFDFAFEWYQDEELVYLVDGVRKPYSHETLAGMYHFLNKQGELYFIEILEDGAYKPIGDVAFWKDDLPIVLDRKYWGKQIGRKVISALVQRGKTLGYTQIHVNEIYDFNVGSRKCFEHVGFHVCGKTNKGIRLVLDIK